MKVIGVIGSRRRNSDRDFRKIYDQVRAIFDDGDTFVSGGCPIGADVFCEVIARELGASITIHHANWPRLGKQAGFARNSYIAADATVLIACVARDRKGGTEDTIRKFLAKAKQQRGRLYLV